MGEYFRFTMEPRPDDIKKFLADSLAKDLAGMHPTDVIIDRSIERSRDRRYKDTDLVKIMTAHDGSVCKFCLDMEAHNPYTYADAKKALPHHPGCRCQIRSIRAKDPLFGVQPATAGKQHRYGKLRAGYKLARAKKYGGNIQGVPQRGAAIKTLRKKGRRIVAPSGYRAIRIRTSRGH